MGTRTRRERPSREKKREKIGRGGKKTSTGRCGGRFLRQPKLTGDFIISEP